MNDPLVLLLILENVQHSKALNKHGRNDLLACLLKVNVQYAKVFKKFSNKKRPSRLAMNNSKTYTMRHHLRNWEEATLFASLLRVNVQYQV